MGRRWCSLVEDFPLSRASESTAKKQKTAAKLKREKGRIRRKLLYPCFCEVKTCPATSDEREDMGMTSHTRRRGKENTRQEKPLCWPERIK